MPTFDKFDTYFWHTDTYNALPITLKSLIEEHAHLDFADFLSTPVQNFSCSKQKIPPCSFINLLSKKAGKVEFFFQPCLFIPVCSSIRDFRVLIHQITRKYLKFLNLFLFEAVKDIIFYSFLFLTCEIDQDICTKFRIY